MSSLYIFNPRQIPAVTNTVSVIDQNGNSLANNFVRNTGDTMNGSLILQGDGTGIVFPNGSIQNLAFDVGRVEQIEHVFDLTSQMENDGTTLKINQAIETDYSLAVPDNNFTFSKISNLSNTINTINSSISNHQNSLNSLRYEMDLLENLNIQDHFNSNDSAINNPLSCWGKCS